MAEPGWYADPTAPSGRRYWDGARWADLDTRTSRRPNAWLWFVLALVVVGALVAALVFLPNSSSPFGATPVDTRTARPTGSQWNELVPSETPSPTAIESGFGAPIDCPISDEFPRSEVRGGEISGGGLTIQEPPGREWRESPAWIDWMYDYNSVIRDIAPGWISNVGVGYIKVSDGFAQNPATMAEQFVTCMASSGMFLGFTKREILINEEYVVSDRIGWRLQSNVYVGNQIHNGIEGDVVDIIVVPTDDEDRFSVYVSCATIGHEENLEQVAVSLETLRYDG
ncbi:DUF2510 domain-containing protein [Tessaracoccus flavus]|uniref:Uncharacterized protein n=1 Tax=Tessaracoccus flavus TaxID=1610493 RepID=A0A1Q2CCZ2_9ACTN|nr:DUF2510 domain-containing protein [Tessaracoccus flavus]AQP43993.1 hypothetical protein RPIT_03495 [Tessaracoccus flavus]SDY31321.1 Protein of unknown function [Tessaracoccus flavus]